MTFHLAVAIAISFWGARGVEIPCQPQAVYVQDAQLPQRDGLPALAATWGPPRCQILYGYSLREWKRENPGYYCAAIVHEVGHLGGLAHTHDGGIMDEDGIPDDRDSVPWSCRQATRRWWAKWHYWR